LHLLRGNQHFDQEDLNRDGVTTTTITPQDNEGPAELLNSPDGEDVTTILIVDDNAELRHFLALRLASRYRVLEAGNGREGVETAISELPDLVISDVMMPEMNGIELARTLSENPDTATIPLILLTAKSTKRDTVEGLQAGADDYLTKPFDTSELIARVAGLIASRKLVRVSALAEFQADTSKPEENKFISRLDQAILEHLNDSSLSVNRLAELLSMDRTSLYRKCQSNCQMSPVVYLRQQRMQVAGRLLRETQMSVSEVAYATGFESISYFSRVFRGEYKTTPSAYSNAA
jgi:DNA-binding response OmpR family regulator